MHLTGRAGARATYKCSRSPLPNSFFLPCGTPLYQDFERHFKQAFKTPLEYTITSCHLIRHLIVVFIWLSPFETGVLALQGLCAFLRKFDKSNLLNMTPEEIERMRAEMEAMRVAHEQLMAQGARVLAAEEERQARREANEQRAAEKKAEKEKKAEEAKAAKAEKDREDLERLRRKEQSDRAKQRNEKWEKKAEKERKEKAEKEQRKAEKRTGRKRPATDELERGERPSRQKRQMKQEQGEERKKSPPPSVEVASAAPAVIEAPTGPRGAVHHQIPHNRPAPRGRLFPVPMAQAQAPPPPPTQAAQAQPEVETQGEGPHTPNWVYSPWRSIWLRQGEKPNESEAVRDFRRSNLATQIPLMQHRIELMKAKIEAAEKKKAKEAEMKVDPEDPEDDWLRRRIAQFNFNETRRGVAETARERFRARRKVDRREQEVLRSRRQTLIDAAGTSSVLYAERLRHYDNLIAIREGSIYASTFVEEEAMQVLAGMTLDNHDFQKFVSEVVEKGIASYVESCTRHELIEISRFQDWLSATFPDPK